MGTAGRAPGDLISIHAPRTGSDHGNRRACARRFISIHAPRTGSDAVGREPRKTETISIHAPRTGSDVFADAHGRITAHFNPRSPHGERHGVLGYSPIAFEFQSTLSARGATGGIQHFVPAIAISIHAPRTGSDALYFPRIAFARYFNPRSPHGERPSGQPEPPAASNFNPRSPHGERRGCSTTKSRGLLFQPTLPARGATTDGDAQAPPRKISTHAPRTGSDGIRGRKQLHQKQFQPTLPARGATE